ncbi:hypothetical protein GCM10028809_43520 [Spirosoma gilvum]
MPGVKTFAGRMNSMGYDGAAILNRFNEVVASGDSAQIAEKAAKLEAMAQKVGWQGDLWGAGKPVVAEMPAATKALTDSSTLGEITKSAWNGLADAVTGLTRTPQVLHDAAGSIYTRLFGEQDAGAKADSERINSFFKGMADQAAQYVDKVKFDTDTSGSYSSGLFSKDSQGDWHYNGIQGAAHSIGQSLGFALSMMGPGLVGKGAKVLGVGSSALRAAQAAGDVEKVTQLTRAAAGTERAMRYVGGVVSQVEPLYQDALEATGDSHKAAAFTAAVAPVVAALDAFTGVESMAMGGRQVSKAAVREAVKQMGEEITEETMKPVLKTLLERQLKDRLVEGGKQFGIEAGTETVQEGYQALVERLFDKAAGNDKLAKHGGDLDARLLNSLAIGGLLGGPMGAAFHQTEIYKPTAFRLLSDAYADGGKEGLAGGVDQLQRAISTSGADVDGRIGLRNQVDKMAEIVSSFKGNSKPDGKTQFQFFDLNYHQLPAAEQTLADYQSQLQSFNSDSPVDSDGSPIDPAVARSLAAQLAPEVADQQRLVTYLSGVRDRLTQTGRYQVWAKGAGVIGKYQPGDRVVGPDQNTQQQIDGTVTELSNDGQFLTIKPADPMGGEPKTVTVRAIDAKPYAEVMQPKTPVQEAQLGDVAVGDNLVVGFTPYQATETDNRPTFQTGQRVVLADDPTRSYPVTVTSNQDGQPTLTIERNGQRLQGTLTHLTDRQNPNRIIGAYSPEMALARQDLARQKAKQEAELQKIRQKLPAATVTALESMDESQLTKRYQALANNKASGDERKFIHLLSQAQGWLASTPEADDQREHIINATAADTPPMAEPIMDAGEEIVDDATFQHIIDSDEIPTEVIADIAARLMAGKALTERQQLLHDGFSQKDENVLIGAMDALSEAVIVQETSQQSPADNESIQSTTANEPRAEATDTGSGSTASAPSGQGESELASTASGEASAGTPTTSTDNTGIPPDDSTPTPTSSDVGEVQTLVAQEPVTNTQPTNEAPLPESAPLAVTGSKVKIRLADRKVTLGTIIGKNADGDIMVRRLNRQGTAEEVFPHPPTALLSEQETPIQVDTHLPLYQAQPTTPPTKIAVGEQVLIPGVAGGQVLAEITAVEGDNVTARVILSGIERTVPVSQVGAATEADKRRTTARLKERKEAVRFQSASTEVEPIGQAAVAHWVDRLRRAFPRVRVVLLSGQAMEERFGDPYRGAVENGAVYINSDTATADTPLHEYAHIYTSVLKKYYPRLFQRGLDLVKGSDYEARVRASYPDLTSDEQVLEEALATAIGEKGVNLPTPSRVQSFLNWAKLMLRRIGEAIGFSLSMETKLDEFIKARASELQSGKVISRSSSPDLALPSNQRQTVAPVQPISNSQPGTIAEAALQAGQLTDQQRKELAEYDVAYDPNSNTYSRVRPDIKRHAADMRKSLAQLRNGGKLVQFVQTYLPILNPDNLMRMAFGSQSPYYTAWQTLQEQQQREVAKLNVAAHDFAKLAYEQLKGRTTYRGATSYEAVEKWDITGEMNDQQQTLSLPVDVILDIVGQYRSLLAQYLHIDPQYKQKALRGEEEAATFQVPNPENSRSPLVITLSKSTLQELEQRVFYQDAGTSALFQAWEQYAAEQFPTIARTYAVINGKPLEQAIWYYPMSVARSQMELAQRSIQQFVDDAGLLKNRQGVPEVLQATGMLQSLGRYSQQAANYVQLAPLWHNLDRLLVNQRQLFDGDPVMHRLGGTLTKLKIAYQTQDIGQQQAQLETATGTLNLDKLLRAATLSRFAFNLAIPLKQITGYTSALGNGAIRDEFLLGREGLGYLATIAESYWLVGKGSQTGSYSGGQTSFDETINELRSVNHPDAAVLLWRVQGAAHPDIQFDDWGSLSADGKLRWAGERMRYFFEEYGLSISQRADSAVVRAFYQAAKTQVRHDEPSLTEVEVRERAIPLAKQALYYSNQTFDKTDKAPLQLNSQFLQRLLSLYRGQNFKIYNTMATRVLQLASAPESDRPAARQRLRVSVATNALLAPLMTFGLDQLIRFVRELPNQDDDKEVPIEQKVRQWTGEALSQVLQVIPGSPGFDFASWLAYKLGNPDTLRTPLDVNPLSTLADFGQAMGELVLTLVDNYRSEETLRKAEVKISQQVLRTGATLTGFSQEITRQLNRAMNLLLPEPKPKHHQHRHSHEPEYDYGLEYLTGTDEESPRGRRH